MTVMAEARAMTANLDFGLTEATWRGISAAKVPIKPLANGEIGLSGTPAEPLSATETAKSASVRRPVAFRPLVFAEEQAPALPEKFLVLQDWEGVVESIGSKTFTARLRDWTNKETYASEIAELPIADVSDDDRELLRPGAIFYLTIGRLTHASGRQDRVGRLVFRRLPVWTASTLRRAEQHADRLRRFLAAQN